VKTHAFTALITICFREHDDEPVSHHTNVSLLHTADNL